MINIILKKNFSSLGNEGDIVKVKYGYALNYLIPNEIAILVTKKSIKNIEEKKLNIIKKNKENIKNLIEKLNKLNVLEIFEKSNNNKLFGSINSKYISKIIYEKTLINIEHKYIYIPNKKIDKTGLYKIYIKKYNKIINIELNIK